MYIFNIVQILADFFTFNVSIEFLKKSLQMGRKGQGQGPGSLNTPMFPSFHGFLDTFPSSPILKRLPTGPTAKASEVSRERR